MSFYVSKKNYLLLSYYVIVISFEKMLYNVKKNYYRYREVMKFTFLYHVCVGGVLILLVRLRHCFSKNQTAGIKGLLPSNIN
jgi:hypothetical protein